MPLRLWLGAVWVFEAVMKIVEGWFGAAKLSAFFGGANAWFDSLLGVANKTVEAVSSATGAAETVVETRCIRFRYNRSRSDHRGTCAD